MVQAESIAIPYASTVLNDMSFYGIDVLVRPVSECVSMSSWVQGGVPVGCPLRCAAPQQIVYNVTVRRIVSGFSPQPPEAPAR